MPKGTLMQYNVSSPKKVLDGSGSLCFDKGTDSSCILIIKGTNWMTNYIVNYKRQPRLEVTVPVMFSLLAVPLGCVVFGCCCWPVIRIQFRRRSYSRIQ